MTTQGCSPLPPKEEVGGVTDENSFRSLGEGCWVGFGVATYLLGNSLTCPLLTWSRLMYPVLRFTGDTLYQGV